MQARDAELDALTQLSNAGTELKARVAELEEELATANRLRLVAEAQSDGEAVLQLKRELAVRSTALPLRR